MTSYGMSFLHFDSVKPYIQSSQDSLWFKYDPNQDKVTTKDERINGLDDFQLSDAFPPFNFVRCGHKCQIIMLQLVATP